MDAEFNRAIRSDIGDVLVNWTRKYDKKPAFEILIEILKSGSLSGSGGFIKGGYKCVCFTETPLAELVKVFSVSKSINDRYEPYGIGVRKQWLFEKGGRPVIYSPEDEYRHLDDKIKWRYVKYSPPQIDFSWEREWRICCEKLELDPLNCVVIVPTRKHAREVTNKYGDHWFTICLSVLGLPMDLSS